MLEFLKELDVEDIDAIFFVPSGISDDTIRIEGCKYKDPGTPIDGSEAGDMYHIMLFKEDDEGKVSNHDLFEAILLEPREYISMLIPQDWYGLVAKKTTTSTSFVQNVFDKLKEV